MSGLEYTAMRTSQNKAHTHKKVKAGPENFHRPEPCGVKVPEGKERGPCT